MPEVTGVLMAGFEAALKHNGHHEHEDDPWYWHADLEAKIAA